MAASAVRIQICGRIAVEVDGVRRDDLLPGPQGRRAFAYLVLRRHEPTARDGLAEALWATGEANEATIVALISKVRKVSPIIVRGGQLHLELPGDAWIDLEVARESIHRAESAVAQGQWARAWGAAQTSLFTARRGFLAGDPAAWAQAVRAERASRELCALAPFRESGYRLLMKALAANGNDGEALLVYEQLRRRLRAELGIDPSEATRALHLDLLRKTSPS